MGGDRSFWFLFGGIWALVGVAFLAATMGVNLFADPDALDPDTPLWVFFAAGLAASGFGGLILRRTYLGAERERRLIRGGVQLTATVTDIRRSRVEINRQPRWYVCYHYNYADRSLTGESEPMTGDAVWELKPGDRVGIKVDPRRPEDSLFLGAE